MQRDEKKGNGKKSRKCPRGANWENKKWTDPGRTNPRRERAAKDHPPRARSSAVPSRIRTHVFRSELMQRQIEPQSDQREHRGRSPETTPLRGRPLGARSADDSPTRRARSAPLPFHSPVAPPRARLQFRRTSSRGLRRRYGPSDCSESPRSLDRSRIWSMHSAGTPAPWTRGESRRPFSRLEGRGGRERKRRGVSRPAQIWRSTHCDPAARAIWTFASK